MGWDLANRFNTTAFYGPVQVRNLFGNGPVSYCFVYIIWILDVFVRWVVVFVQNLSFFIYKGPIRACRRVSVYSSHWSRLMGILPSSFFLLYYVTAAIFQLYKKLNSTCTYSFIGSLSSNGPTFSPTCWYVVHVGSDSWQQICHVLLCRKNHCLPCWCSLPK